MKVKLTALSALVVHVSTSQDVAYLDEGLPVCTPNTVVSTPSASNYFTNLLTTGNWPARWDCGDWSEPEGWAYILSDFTIFLAYLSITIILLFYLRKKRVQLEKSLQAVLLLFSAFIFLCGITHLIDAILFWEPIYRLSGFTKGITSLFSLGTALVLGFVMPKAFRLPEEINEQKTKRKKVQNQLEVFLKYSPRALAMFDNQMECLIANEKWNSSFNNSGNNLTGKPIIKILPNLSYFDNWNHHLQNALNGKSSEDNPAEFPSESGTTYWRWGLHPWYDETDEIGGVIMTLESITEKVKLREELKVSEARFRNIFEKAQFGIALLDRSAKPFFFNSQFSKILGCEREKLEQKSVLEVTHPKDRKSDYEQYLRLLGGEIEDYTLEKRFIDDHEKIKYTSCTTTLIEDSVENETYALQVVMDFTEKEKAEAEKRAVQQRIKRVNLLFQELSEVARIGSWELDLQSKEVEWSDTVYDIHEVDKSTKILVEEGINFYHPDDREIIGRLVQNGIEHGESWDEELRLITAKNKMLWVRAIGQPVMEQGQITRLRGLFQDIDKKKRNELLVENARKQLEKEVSERTADLQKANSELESFTYSVSHDLRAPLRAINGFAQALKEDFQDRLDESANQYLNRITANGIKMGNLIDDLLEFSQMSRKKADFSEIDTNLLVHDLIESLFFENRGIIHVSKLPVVVGDLQMLRQVFVNLIANALKYSSKSESPRVEIFSKTHDDHTEISIKDNGVGFNMKYADKLFKVFSRLHSDNEFEGTGIGLALSKKIMDAQHGEIKAFSEQGNGATFKLIFYPSN
ncbi:MAG: PAS domain S-box protein [Bacteroidota bacterium]